MARRKNVVEKFKKWFASLTLDEQRDLYDLLVMLRGPDDNSGLKSSITSRIRYVLGIWDSERELQYRQSPDHIHVYRPAFNSEPFPDKKTLMEMLKVEQAPDHYKAHAIEAINRLVELGIIKSETKCEQ